MSTADKSQVDRNNNKIKSDILVSGYIREAIQQELDLKIPSEITKLCFIFWFIKPCDKWNKQLSHKDYQITQENLILPPDINGELNYCISGTSLAAYDMLERYQLQSQNAPKSTFSNDDVTESANGSSKYEQQRAAHISPHSREAACVNAMNGDAWNTFDQLEIYECDEFKRKLTIWHDQHESYATMNRDKQFDNGHFHRCKTSKIRRVLRSTTVDAPIATNDA